MLEEANRRSRAGSDVVVGAVDARDREDVNAELEHLELIGDGATLDTAAVLARRPEVVCIDDLTAGTTTAERRFVAARRLADAGITVVGTVQLGRLGGTPDGGPEAYLDESALLALADEIELVDVPPSILTDRVRRGQIVPPDQVPSALAIDLRAGDAAGRARARVPAGGRARRASASSPTPGEDAVVSGPERQPSIVACAAPWPGMEPLIRRSAALAAQVDGQFRVAAVRLAAARPSRRPAAGRLRDLDRAARRRVRHADGRGPGPGAGGVRPPAAGDRARPEPGVPESGSRFPVLRELARLAGDVELHVLPAERDR